MSTAGRSCCGTDGGEPDYRCAAGVDEAGRGPLAGPVVVAAVMLCANYHLPGLRDSKKISAGKREALEPEIRRQAISCSVVFVSSEEIDRINILQATLQGMQRAVELLEPRPLRVFVDGNQQPELNLPTTTIVGGDDLLACISAASILAKVARDRYMCAQDSKFPGYGFARHKGYGTPQHLRALARLGPCALHRRSFTPLRNSLPATEVGQQTATAKIDAVCRE